MHPVISALPSLPSNINYESQFRLFVGPSIASRLHLRWGVRWWLVSLGDVERMCVVLVSVCKPACSVRVMIDYQKGNTAMKIERSHATLSRQRQGKG